MFCYKDKCYCIRSSDIWCNDNGLKQCTNTKCNRHCSEIPFDKLPEYMMIDWADFANNCEDYKKENKQ